MPLVLSVPKVRLIQVLGWFFFFLKECITTKGDEGTHPN